MMARPSDLMMYRIRPLEWKKEEGKLYRIRSWGDGDRAEFFAETPLGGYTIWLVRKGSEIVRELECSFDVDCDESQKQYPTSDVAKRAAQAHWERWLTASVLDSAAPTDAYGQLVAALRPDELVEAVVFGGEAPHAGRAMSLNEARPHLTGWLFDDFGTEPVVVWTDQRIFYVYYYDAVTSLRHLPRNPCDFLPEFDQNL